MLGSPVLRTPRAHSCTGVCASLRLYGRHGAIHVLIVCTSLRLHVSVQHHGVRPAAPHLADALSPSLLKHLLKGEGGAAARMTGSVRAASRSSARPAAPRTLPARPARPPRSANRSAVVCCVCVCVVCVVCVVCGVCLLCVMCAVCCVCYVWCVCVCVCTYTHIHYTTHTHSTHTQHTHTQHTQFIGAITRLHFLHHASFRRLQLDQSRK